MVASYRKLLTEEEIKPILEKLTSFSLDEVESKLAVIYSRKQQASFSKREDFQVNINTLNAELEKDVPEFFKQAAEYDRLHGLNY